ncbi:MAG TPA: IS200/IS605 family transposase [Caldithrix abyssi]|uniref:IS200/IS605 family transposase n=1 Tax=Caldithrix abyssi TaxID=187145 RepID=A0A7V4WVR3_CALAY|nr:IS200/IS605 family transposase [Caldithrix abyssi]
MAQSLAKIYLHIIFSTKNKEKLIKPEIEKDLHAYMAGILKNLDCTAIIIGGTNDHVHILNTFSRVITISKMLEILKKESSKWIKKRGLNYDNFYWQNGYGAFSVSQSRVENVKKYIENQKSHHRTISFKEEFIRFLKEYNVEYDERYVWD